jgi:hypothetical protein
MMPEFLPVLSAVAGGSVGREPQLPGWPHDRRCQKAGGVQSPADSLAGERLNVAGGITGPVDPITDRINNGRVVGERRCCAKKCVLESLTVDQLRLVATRLSQQVGDHCCRCFRSSNARRGHRRGEIDPAVLKSHEPTVARSPHGHHESPGRQTAVVRWQGRSEANPVVRWPAPRGRPAASWGFDPDRVGQATCQHKPIAGETLFAIIGCGDADANAGGMRLAGHDAGLR